MATPMKAVASPAEEEASETAQQELRWTAWKARHAARDRIIQGRIRTGSFAVGIIVLGAMLLALLQRM